MLCFAAPVAKEPNATRTAGKIQQRCGGLNNRHLTILPAKLLLEYLYRKNLNGSDFTQSNIKNTCKALSILKFQSLEYFRLWQYANILSLVCKTMAVVFLGKKGNGPNGWSQGCHRCVVSPLLAANEEVLAAAVCNQAD